MTHDDARVFRSAKLIAVCTLLSRITGLARDIILNWKFGQNWIQDAFNYGFQIPNLFRRLFGEGALSAVFVPVFTEVLDRDGRPAAWQLLGRVTGLLGLVLALLTVALEVGVLIVWWVAPGDAMRGLMLGLTGLMLPFMISICLLALFSSILNCLNHFTVPALAPIVLNVCNILGVLFVGPAMSRRPEVQIYGVAASVLAASLLQLAIVIPVLRRHGVTFRIGFAWHDPAVRRMLRTLLPILLGQGVLLLNVYFDAQVCTFLTRGPNQPESRTLAGVEFRYPLVDGALSAVNNAQRLYQFPLGVLAISLATAAFPLMSRHAARADLPALRAASGDALRMAIFEGLPAGLVLLVLSQPIVALLFQHGQFGPEQTQRTAWVLIWYGLGLWAFCAQHIVARAFYSLKDTLTPMWIGCALVVLNQGLNLALIWHDRLREAAFGISTSVTAALNVLIGLWILRRRMGGRIGGRALFSALLRMLLAAAIATAAAWGMLRALAWPEFTGGLSLARRAVGVFVPLGGAIVVYLAAARLLGLPEVGRLLALRRRSAASDDSPATPV